LDFFSKVKSNFAIFAAFDSRPQTSAGKIAMSSPIIVKVIEQMHELPVDLQQQVLAFVLNLRQEHQQKSDNAWDVLESLTATVEAPSDWSAESDHYLYGTPKCQ
jgi:hypothetical protein